MLINHTCRKTLPILFVIVGLMLATGCASARPATTPPNPAILVQQQAAAISPTPPVGTVTQPATPDGSTAKISLEFLLPFQSSPASDIIHKQVSDFEAQYGEKFPGLQINLTFLDSLSLRDTLSTMVAAGAQLPTMAALDYNTVIEFNQMNLVQHPDESADFWNTFLADAVNNISRDGQVFGYPWQRYSCSPNYLSLVIFNNPRTSPEVTQAARELSVFLTNAVNQKNNFTSAGLQAYPTLKSLYATEGIQCPVFTKIPVNPALVGQIFDSARQQSVVFENSFKLQSSPAQVAGLDTSALPNGTNNVLQAYITPAANDQQFYHDRQVIGYLFTINDSLSPRTLSIQSKASMQYGRLPGGAFMFACKPRSDDCLAVSPAGEEFQIDPASITWSDLPDPILVPTSAFVKGSYIIQFYIGSVRYTITIF